MEPMLCVAMGVPRTGRADAFNFAGHCPHSFDVCTPCLTSLPHDPSHVFLTFTRKVDLTLFREM